MQWSAAANAGFSAAAPWLPIADDYQETNVERESVDSKSMLTLYRRLTALRKREAALSIGGYTAVPQTGDLLSYRRQFDNARSFLIILNFGHEAAVFDDKSVPRPGAITLSTHLDREREPFDGRIALRPDEGLLIELAGRV
jgi:alpha-glucosidase